MGGAARNLWLVGSTAGATPAGVALFSAFLALVALKFVVNHALAVPSMAVNRSMKEGKHMTRTKVMFAAVLDTIHRLGVSGLASCLLAKGSMPSNNAFRPTTQVPYIRTAAELRR